jgi:hypothetical protein
MSNKPVVSSITPQTPLLDPKTGQISFTWIKWFQGIQQAVNTAFDQQGNFDGNLGADATIANRSATILVILHNIDDNGVVTAEGIDFSRNYLNKDTDHINDGLGSPLAGGKLAFAALVSSMPAEGQILVFNGMQWLPHAKATTIAKVAHQWLDSYSDTAGTFTQSQPSLSDIADVPPFPVTASPAANKWLKSYDSATGIFTETQPAFTDVSGQITVAQAPAAGLSVTITTAKLTTGGANGSMTFQNGILTAQVQAT